MDGEKKIRRILVVDDQAMARKVISRIMSNHGHVDLAENGLDALALFAAALEDGWPFDLVCMDVTMHGLLTGNQAVKCIRAHEAKLAVEKPVPVVMISSAVKQDEIQWSLEFCGADDYIAKPFDHSRINEVIKKYLY